MIFPTLDFISSTSLTLIAISLISDSFSQLSLIASCFSGPRFGRKPPTYCKLEYFCKKKNLPYNHGSDFVRCAVAFLKYSAYFVLSRHRSASDQLYKCYCKNIYDDKNVLKT